MVGINDAMTRVHIEVSGKVQSISFREEIKKRADKYGVRGFAKNHLDGHVEIVFEGERTAVLKVREWLEKGRHLARYERYEFKWKMFINEFKGGEFEIR